MKKKREGRGKVEEGKREETGGEEEGGEEKKGIRVQQYFDLSGKDN